MQGFHDLADRIGALARETVCIFVIGKVNGECKDREICRIEREDVGVPVKINLLIIDGFDIDVTCRNVRGLRCGVHGFLDFFRQWKMINVDSLAVVGADSF